MTASPVGASQFNGSDEAALEKAAPTRNGLAAVIVKLDYDSLASYEGGIAGLPATSPAVTGDAKLDVDAPESERYLDYAEAQRKAFEARAESVLPESRVTGRFDVVFGGVSMAVPVGELEKIANLPGVESIEPDTLLQLDTERSPQFIGAPTLWNGLGGQGSAGEGVIVGVLDTGVWPEHASYSDPDPLGKPYAAPAAAPDGDRACEFSGGSRPGAPFTCNNKLIGADRFMATYEAFGPPLLPGEFTSARDDVGHGTHTSTTAAGNRGVAASIFGVPRGTVSGVAPRAHIIGYKVCGDIGCFGSDSVAAAHEAIEDGVDVINFSIGGGNNPYADAVELAFLDAYEAGVFVAASAGNSGPGLDTVSHRGPWVTTVAASTSDRHFVADLTLTASNGDTFTAAGSTVTEGIGTPTPVVDAGAAPYNDPFCLQNPNPTDNAFAGKVVICQRGGGTGNFFGRVLKSWRVQLRGGVGMILRNPTLQGENTDNHFVPSVHIENDEGDALAAFFTGHTGVMATLSESTARTVPGDVMAPFSSRGGPGQNIGVSKPDITAPGVQILAGHSPEPAVGPDGPLGGRPGQLFQAIQGTSMSSPHIAGSAALIVDRRPTWTPGQIKSALMTTATTDVENADGSPTTPFDDGSGRVDLRDAADAGITFDVTAAEYDAYASKQDLLYQLNYPSVYIPVMPGLVKIHRTAKNVTNDDVEYELDVDSPSDLKISVRDELEIDERRSKTFDITIDARNVPIGGVRHATLKFEGDDGETDLVMPITIVRKQPIVTLDKSCSPTTIERNQTTGCSIVMTNNSFSAANVSMKDELPRELDLIESSVVGGTADGNKVRFNGSLFGATPPIDVAPAASPAGYVPLPAPAINCAGNCDDTGFNFNMAPFGSVRYNGAVFNTVGMATNGFVQLGGLTSTTATNQNLPNPLAPNNLVAPLWTDLHPLGGNGLGGGTLDAAIATIGPAQYLVLEWRNVFEFGGAAPKYTFEVWLQLGGAVQDISFVYQLVNGTPSSGRATVGAENAAGDAGKTRYFNGTGTFPTAGPAGDLKVTFNPIPGETKTVTFNARGDKRGSWQNCAEMTSNLFFGTNLSCVNGVVTR